MSVGTFIQLESPRRIRRRGLAEYHGLITYLCDARKAIGVGNGLYGGTVSSVPNAICFDYEIEYMPWGLPGLAAIFAHYDTAGSEVLPAGQARLYMETDVARERMRLDAQGNVIEGTVRCAGNSRVNRWRLVSGDGAVVRRRMRWRIVCFVNRGDLAGWRANIKRCYGKINSNSFSGTKIDAGEEQLWLCGALTQEQLVADPGRVDLLLAEDPGGWNNQISVRPEAFVLNDEPAYEDQTATGSSGMVAQWSPNRWWTNGLSPGLVDAADERRDGFETADMSWISDLSIVD